MLVHKNKSTISPCNFQNVMDLAIANKSKVKSLLILIGDGCILLMVIRIVTLATNLIRVFAPMKLPAQKIVPLMVLSKMTGAVPMESSKLTVVFK